MKKIIFILGIGISNFNYAQWLGSTTSTGNIYRSANVGIGTTAPVTSLNIQTAAMNDGVRITQTGSSASALGLFNSGPGASNWGLFSTGGGNGQGTGHFIIYDYTSNADRFFIQKATGNVGIGTIKPTHKLHVNDGIIQVTGPNSWGGPMMVFGPSVPSGPNAETWGIETMPTGLNFWRPFNGQTNAGNYFLFLKHTTGNIGIRTDNPTAGLTVNSNVLIGDPNVVSLPSGYKLYVEQGILTERLKVAIKNSANWSDYVFAEDYKLKPLKEVESFVLQNKHLPGIPSANDMVKEGMDVAEMNAKLLEKIEELTLYVIGLQKEVEQLKSNEKKQE